MTPHDGWMLIATGLYAGLAIAARALLRRARQP